jgi:hypothetical protein
MRINLETRCSNWMFYDLHRLIIVATIHKPILESWMSVANIVEWTVGISTLGSMLLYAPFTMRWRRALIVPFTLMSLFVVLCFIVDLFIKRDSSDLRGIFALPFVAITGATVVRGIKLLLFRVPYLDRAEKSLRRKVQELIKSKHTRRGHI